MKHFTLALLATTSLMASIQQAHADDCVEGTTFLFYNGEIYLGNGAYPVRSCGEKSLAYANIRGGGNIFSALADGDYTTAILDITGNDNYGRVFAREENTDARLGIGGDYNQANVDITSYLSGYASGVAGISGDHNVLSLFAEGDNYRVTMSQIGNYGNLTANLHGAAYDYYKNQTPYDLENNVNMISEGDYNTLRTSLGFVDITGSDWAEYSSFVDDTVPVNSAEITQDVRGYNSRIPYMEFGHNTVIADFNLVADIDIRQIVTSGNHDVTRIDEEPIYEQRDITERREITEHQEILEPIYETHEEPTGETYIDVDGNVQNITETVWVQVGERVVGYNDVVTGYEDVVVGHEDVLVGSRMVRSVQNEELIGRENELTAKGKVLAFSSSHMEVAGAYNKLTTDQIGGYVHSKINVIGNDNIFDVEQVARGYGIFPDDAGPRTYVDINIDGDGNNSAAIGVAKDAHGKDIFGSKAGKEGIHQSGQDNAIGVSATGNFNQFNIEQVGGQNNFTFVNVRGLPGTTGLSNKVIATQENSALGYAFIIQVGDDNRVESEQKAGSNIYLRANQRGLNNLIIAEQSGNDQRINVIQDGNNNQVVALQPIGKHLANSNNLVQAVQTGAYNKLKTTQDGYFNKFYTTQDGNNNNMILETNGYGKTINALQKGTSNVMNVKFEGPMIDYKAGERGSNELTIEQYGNNNRYGTETTPVTILSNTIPKGLHIRQGTPY